MFCLKTQDPGSGRKSMAPAHAMVFYPRNLALKTRLFSLQVYLLSAGVASQAHEAVASVRRVDGRTVPTYPRRWPKPYESDSYGYG